MILWLLAWIPLLPLPRGVVPASLGDRLFLVDPTAARVELWTLHPSGETDFLDEVVFPGLTEGLDRVLPVPTSEGLGLLLVGHHPLDPTWIWMPPYRAEDTIRLPVHFNGTVVLHGQLFLLDPSGAYWSLHHRDRGWAGERQGVLSDLPLVALPDLIWYRDGRPVLSYDGRSLRLKDTLVLLEAAPWVVPWASGLAVLFVQGDTLRLDTFQLDPDSLRWLASGGLALRVLHAGGERYACALPGCLGAPVAPGDRVILARDTLAVEAEGLPVLPRLDVQRGPDLQGDSLIRYRLFPEDRRLDIELTLPEAARIRFTLTSPDGRNLLVLDEGYRGAGVYTYHAQLPLQWAPGVYLLKLQDERGTRSFRKILMLPTR